MIGALVEEIYSDNKTWEFPNCSLDKPGWKGKGGGKGGKLKRSVTGQNESTTRADSQQDSFDLLGGGEVNGQKETTIRADTEQDTNSTYDILRGGGVTGQNETTTRTDSQQHDGFAGTNFANDMLQGQNETTTRANSEQDSFSGTNFTYIFKRPLTSTLPPVSD